jgi:predicted amidophosphoribosyltransferase
MNTLLSLVVTPVSLLVCHLLYQSSVKQGHCVYCGGKLVSSNGICYCSECAAEYQEATWTSRPESSTESHGSK